MPVKVIRASYEALNQEEKQKNDIGEIVTLPPRIKLGQQGLRSGAIQANIIAGDLVARYDGKLVSSG